MQRYKYGLPFLILKNDISYIEKLELRNSKNCFLKKLPTKKGNQEGNSDQGGDIGNHKKWFVSASFIEANMH